MQRPRRAARSGSSTESRNITACCSVDHNFISRFVVILEPPRFIYVARISEPGAARAVREYFMVMERLRAG